MSASIGLSCIHGMTILGVPYTEPELANVREIGGGWPYGAGTLAGPDGSRTPTDHELRIVRAQGRRVAEIAKLLKGGELIEDVLRGVSHDQG